ncbi:hypothetical protein GCM10009530_16670 [Microbispora corallina]|uniref:anticodon-binding protein n=1 Tax=Microbispora corallina TaxID=83302 RepID=UPI0031E27E69
MTPARLTLLLGAPPVPRGSWAEEAVLASAAALRTTAGRGAVRAAAEPDVVRTPAEPGAVRDAAERAERIAGRLRGEDGVAEVRVGRDGFLSIVLAEPGEIVREIVEGRPEDAGAPTAPVVAPSAWPDAPLTWDNPGFVVRYAHARAVAVQRWAADLGVPAAGFRPGLLTDPGERAVLRLLAELPGRAASREPAWALYAERLALAYHDAHERAPAVPSGDRPAGQVHTARTWLAAAVRDVLRALIGPGLPDRV